MNRKITCINDDNISLEFGSSFSPFLLQDCEGIYAVENDVSTKENTLIDGSTYYGSHTKMRNIILTLAENGDHAANRNVLYRLFKAKGPGRFIYTEGDTIREIEYVTESVQFTSVNDVRFVTISLICPEPYFTDRSDIIVVMSGWEGAFQFPHQFKMEPLGNQIKEQLKVIDNSASDEIGITATITAEDALTNPSLYHVELDEFIKVGTAQKPFEMKKDDKLIITTETNNKNVCLVRNGVRTIVNEYLDEDSTFFQLNQGFNSIRYDAGTGVDHMLTSISFRYKYLGV